MCSACLLNVDNKNMRATADLLLNRLKLHEMLQNHWLTVARAFVVTAGNGLYKISPKEAQGCVFLTGPACPCGSSTLASQHNKLCFVDCIHTWLFVSRRNRNPVPNNMILINQDINFKEKLKSKLITF
jgi:hypothetical protein